MGGSLCVGILGAWLSFALAGRLATPAGAGIDVTAALRPETHRLLSSGQLQVVQHALGLSLRDVFLQMTALAVLAIVCSIGLRGGRAVPHDAAAGEPSGEETAVEVSMAMEL
jgi:hypothetical protein